MEKWEEVLAREEFGMFDYLKGPAPEDDEPFRLKMLGKCKENLCGCYGTNWGCPPGACDDPGKLYAKTSFVLVIKRTYELDVNNRSLTEKATREMQDSCRLLMLSLWKEGVECTAYMDGPCRYCGVCAYPDPCRYPDMRIKSVSALGIDMEGYLKGLDEEFSFRKDRMTLYGLFFMQRCCVSISSSYYVRAILLMQSADRPCEGL